MNSDTIVALSTPPGSAALALIRLSGQRARETVEKLAGRSFKPREATYCELTFNAAVLDDVVVTVFAKPASYTGEDMAEIACHGNQLIVENILHACCRSGARLARPGEFTERAFLNGKMDLTQAEAVMDLIHAKSERSLKAAQKIKEGRLGRIVLEQREQLLQLLSHLEAYIDFPDEDIEPETGQSFVEQMRRIQKNIAELIGTADEGRKLREGLRVVLVGKPNAGKSTLLNTLLQQDRAIVSDQPGTTRDTVEESILLEGIQIRFIDTAGLRDQPDAIEKLGIERTRKAIESADLVLNLIDGSDAQDKPEDMPQDKPEISCITKADLKQKSKAAGLRISAVTGEGISALKEKIVEKLSLAETTDSREMVAINARHEEALRRADLALVRALENASSPPEMLSSDLRQALQAVGEVVGETTNEDILDRLFQNFCIGK